MDWRLLYVLCVPHQKIFARSMNLKYLNFLVAFFLIVFSSCSNEPKEIKQPRKDSGAPLKAEAYIIKPLALNASLQIAGTLKPYEETEIHPEVSGRVVQLSLREGSFVNKGTVLARLFDGDLQAQLNKLNVQLQIARKTRERQDQLLKIGGISQQDFDLSVLNESTIVADIQIMKAEIAKTVIRAPFSGKIGFKNISIGAYVTPETIVTTIRQINKLKLEFSVPERYTPKIKNGSIINFTTEASNKQYSARIVATESGITEENRSLKVHGGIIFIRIYCC